MMDTARWILRLARIWWSCGWFNRHNWRIIQRPVDTGDRRYWMLMERCDRCGAIR